MTGIEPPSHWSATERAVWDALAAGRAANLNAISGGTGPEVDDDAGWASATGRTLSTRFIRDLLSAPYVEALPDEIIFLGARFQSAFLVDGGIDATLSFVACHLPGLFLIGGAVAGMLHLARTRVASDIWIERVDFIGGIEILGGRIDGALKLADVDIAEQVVIRPSRTAHLSATPDSGEIPLTLAGGFSATRVMFQHSVHISGTATDECLDIVASTVTGDLSLDHNSAASLGFSQSRIGGNLFVHNNQVVGGIDFEHGVVSGGVSWINTGGAKAALSAEDLSVGRSLRISDSKLTLLDIDRAAIAHDVTISNVSGGSAQEAPYFAARRARVGGSLSLKCGVCIDHFSGLGRRPTGCVGFGSTPWRARRLGVPPRRLERWPAAS